MIPELPPTPPAIIATNTNEAVAPSGEHFDRAFSPEQRAELRAILREQFGDDPAPIIRAETPQGLILIGIGIAITAFLTKLGERTFEAIFGNSDGEAKKVRDCLGKTVIGAWTVLDRLPEPKQDRVLTFHFLATEDEAIRLHRRGSSTLADFFASGANTPSASPFTFGVADPWRARTSAATAMLFAPLGSVIRYEARFALPRGTMVEDYAKEFEDQFSQQEQELLDFILDEQGLRMTKQPDPLPGPWPPKIPDFKGE